MRMAGSLSRATPERPGHSILRTATSVSAFYYTHVFADTKSEDVVYMENTSLFRSADAGKTMQNVSGGTHGDFHDLWIDPDNAAHMVVANDGGGAVTMNTGQSWTDQDFPTSQWYHAITTAHLPYHVCGSQQDNSTLCVPGNWNLGAGGGRGGRGGATQAANRTDAEMAAGASAVSYQAGGGEPGYIATDPNDPDPVLFGHQQRRLPQQVQPPYRLQS